MSSKCPFVLVELVDDTGVRTQEPHFALRSCGNAPNTTFVVEAVGLGLD